MAVPYFLTCIHTKLSSYVSWQVWVYMRSFLLYKFLLFTDQCHIFRLQFSRFSWIFFLCTIWPFQDKLSMSLQNLVRSIVQSSWDFLKRENNRGRSYETLIHQIFVVPLSLQYSNFAVLKSVSVADVFVFCRFWSKNSYALSFYCAFFWNKPDPINKTRYCGLSLLFFGDSIWRYNDHWHLNDVFIRLPTSASFRKNSAWIVWLNPFFTINYTEEILLSQCNTHIL